MIAWLGRLRLLAVCAAVLVIPTMGCGGKVTGPKRIPLSGTVKREGIAIDSGNIVFRSALGDPKDKDSVGSSTVIKEGRYSFNRENGPPVGKYKVQITADPNYDKSYKGKPNEAPILDDPRFKNKIPPKGWTQEAEVSESVKTLDLSVE